MLTRCSDNEKSKEVTVNRGCNMEDKHLNGLFRRFCCPSSLDPQNLTPLSNELNFGENEVRTFRRLTTKKLER